jgi:hypothetical protein
MDGNFRNNKQKHEEIIESWMRTSISDGGVSRFDDLHIDRIDHEWKSQNLWIPAAFHVHDLAVNIRDRCKIGLSVVVAFSLKVSERPTGIDFRTQVELEARFDQSPPSLYLFPRGREPWMEVHVSAEGNSNKDIVAHRMPPGIFGSMDVHKKC